MDEKLNLSPREVQILTLLAEGYGRGGIADKLGITKLNLNSCIYRMKRLRKIETWSETRCRETLERYKRTHPHPGFTDRRLELLKRFANGESNEDIAAAMGIKPGTVITMISQGANMMRVNGYVGPRKRAKVRQWLIRNGYMPAPAGYDPMNDIVFQ
jgi:DNA-binding NarL/FixJ family response regulator